MNKCKFIADMLDGSGSSVEIDLSFNMLFIKHIVDLRGKDRDLSDVLTDFISLTFDRDGFAKLTDLLQAGNNAYCDEFELDYKDRQFFRTIVYNSAHMDKWEGVFKVLSESLVPKGLDDGEKPAETKKKTRVKKA